MACKNETQSPTRSFYSTRALDPGVRIFKTNYDADGVGIEWGEGDLNQIFVFIVARPIKPNHEIAKKRATWLLRRAYHRKIKDKIKECHNKLVSPLPFVRTTELCCSFLSSRYRGW